MATYSEKGVKMIVALQQVIDGSIKEYEDDYLGHHFALVSKRNKKSENWITLLVDGVNERPIEIAKYNAITMDDPVVMYEVITSTIYHYY